MSIENLETIQAPELAPRPTLKGILACVVGASLVCFLAWAFFVYPPWGAIGRVCLSVLSAIWTGVRAPVSLAALHPGNTLAILATALLSWLCIRTKYTAYFDEVMQKKSNEVILGFCVGALLMYLFGMLVAVIVAHANDFHTRRSLEDRTGLTYPLYEMNASFARKKDLSFQERVDQVNDQLAKYGHTEDGEFVPEPAPPVVLVDADQQIIAMRATLTLGTCRALAEPNARFVAVAINGIPVRSPANILAACKYGWENEAVVNNRPDEWRPGNND